MDVYLDLLQEAGKQADARQHDLILGLLKHRHSTQSERRKRFTEHFPWCVITLELPNYVYLQCKRSQLRRLVSRDDDYSRWPSETVAALVRLDKACELGHTQIHNLKCTCEK